MALFMVKPGWLFWSRLVCGLLFAAAGVMHFLKPQMYLKVMPPGIPLPLECIYISGVAEIVGGLGLLFKQTRQSAAVGLIVLLVAVFPANIYMANRPDIVPAIPEWLLYVRLPLQLLLALWVWGLRR